ASLSVWWQTRRQPAVAVASAPRLLGDHPAASLGTNMALHAGRGRRAVPARPTLVAAVAAVAAVVGALAFASSLHHLTHTPRLYGQDFDEMIRIESHNGAAILAREGPRLAADHRVEAVSRYHVFDLSLGRRGQRT